MRTVVGLASVAVALAFPLGARAQPTVEPTLGGAELRSVTMGAEQVEIVVPLVINLGPERIVTRPGGNTRTAVTRPINIPFDVYYGVSNDLTVGFTHSRGTVQAVGVYRLYDGLCLTSDGCPSVYDNLGFDALYRLLGGVIQIAGHGGLDIDSITNSDMAIRVGALFKAPLAVDMALLADPRLALDVQGGGLALGLPLGVQLMTDAGVRLALQTGLDGALADYARSYVGWLAAFASVGVNEKIEAFLSFTFPSLYGPNRDLAGRALTAGFNIRPF